MIEADPGNSLILGNYAKFLKEVHLTMASLLIFSLLDLVQLKDE